jgi:transposase-like protein
MSESIVCPKCNSDDYVKSGIVQERQRYKCKACKYYFTVQKMGKKVDDYYVTKALQLYMEGLSYREIERILGISHVSVMNWVKTYKVKRPSHLNYRPTYKILTQSELVLYVSRKENLTGAGFIITELGDKYMMIKWERFRD